MKNKGIFDGKHLVLDDRKIIEQALNDNSKLKDIAFLVNKDDRTISKEVNRNKVKIDYSKKRIAWNVEFKNLESCKILLRFPFVCNGCKKKQSCYRDHFYYYAKDAQERYESLLVSSRTGIDLTKDELETIDKLVKEGTKKGQSIYAICLSNKNEITKTPGTLYTYVHKGVLSTSPLDLRRSAKMKPRIKDGKYAKTKDERAIYVNRTIENYYEFIIINHNPVTVQMDTVEGSKKSTKYLFTMQIPLLHFMFIYLIDSQTSNEIKRVLDDIERKIGLENFKKLFPCILTDRGKEFIDPDSFELSIDGKTKRTNIFYCDPMEPNQKPHIERNHELLRYVIPGGSFMDKYTDNDILLLTSHLNSYPRKEIGGMAPYDSFVKLYGEEILLKLFIDKVEPNDVNLTPSLLVK